MSFAAPPWGDHIYADDDEVILLGWVAPDTPHFLLYAITFSVYCILLEFFDFVILFLLR